MRCFTKMLDDKLCTPAEFPEMSLYSAYDRASSVPNKVARKAPPYQ
jgi:hypothetical protein